MRIIITGRALSYGMAVTVLGVGLYLFLMGGGSFVTSVLVLFASGCSIVILLIQLWKH